MLNNGSLATSRRQNHSCSVEFNLRLIETLYFFINVKNAPPQQLLIIDVWFEIANCCSRLYNFFAYSLKKTASNIWIKNFTGGLQRTFCYEYTDGPKFIQQIFYFAAKQTITLLMCVFQCKFLFKTTFNSHYATMVIVFVCGCGGAYFNAS